MYVIAALEPHDIFQSWVVLGKSPFLVILYRRFGRFDRSIALSVNLELGQQGLTNEAFPGLASGHFGAASSALASSHELAFEVLENMALHRRLCGCLH